MANIYLSLIVKYLYTAYGRPDSACYRDLWRDRSQFLHVLLQHVFDPCLRNRANNLVDRLPILENQQGRNSHNVEPTRRPRVLVRVQFPESYLPLVLLRKPIDHWGDYTAGPTPRSPAVNQDQRILGNERVEAGIAYFYWRIRRISHDDLEW